MKQQTTAENITNSKQAVNLTSQYHPRLLEHNHNTSYSQHS